MLAVAGFRGAISLALALAVPEQLVNGEPLPGRDLIVFVTAGVIVMTLTQGLLLPRIVCWAQLPHDDSVEKERHLAETLAVEAALSVIPTLVSDLRVDQAVAHRLSREYEHHLQVARANGEGAADAPALGFNQQYTALRLAVIAHERSSTCATRAASTTPPCVRCRAGST